MFASIAYREAIRELDKLYGDFCSYKDDLGAYFLKYYQETAKGDAALYIKRLYEIHYKFMDAALKKYPFIKTLYEKYNSNPSCKEEYPTFESFARTNLESLFKQISITRLNVEENLENFSFLKTYKKFRALKEEINKFKELAENNLKKIRKQENKEK